jgi:DNA segregation ATPase FtsK/SpoIIIE-like protein
MHAELAEPGGYPAREEAFEPPIDVKHDYPDLVTDSVSVGPAPMLYDAATAEDHDEVHESQEQLFPTTLKPVGEYVLPDRSLLKKSRPGAGPNGEANQRIAEALVTCLAHFGVEATVIGQIAGPRVTRYELQVAPGTKVGKVPNLKDDLSYALATTEIGSSRRSPASRRSAWSSNLSEPRHARRHLRRPAADSEPALGVARQGHLRAPRSGPTSPACRTS